MLPQRQLPNGRRCPLSPTRCTPTCPACAQTQVAIADDDDEGIGGGPGLGARTTAAPAGHLQRPGAVVCVRRARIGVFRLWRASSQQHGASSGPPSKSGWPEFNISRLAASSEEQRGRVCHQLQQRLALCACSSLAAELPNCSLSTMIPEQAGQRQAHELGWQPWAGWGQVAQTCAPRRSRMCKEGNTTRVQLSAVEVKCAPTRPIMHVARCRPPRLAATC